MTEFTQGIVNVVRNKIDESLALAIIFFIGHIIIAMTVVSIITGASIWEAGAVAIVEPAINSVWFYILHKAWKKFKA
tara:strand:+ start:1112 stop:1342 length:231 start_codon:yes stop_codon:yes gene_type:complete